MRMALIILVLATMAVAKVHLCRQEMTAKREIQTTRQASLDVRRELWDQQIGLGYLTAPAQVETRAQQMAMDFINRDEVAPRPIKLADNSVPAGQRRRR